MWFGRVLTVWCRLDCMVQAGLSCAVENVLVRDRLGLTYAPSTVVLGPAFITITRERGCAAVMLVRAHRSSQLFVNSSIPPWSAALPKAI